MPDSRDCTKCGQVKPLEAFSKGQRGKYGRRSVCRECVALQYKANYVPRPRTKRREPFTGDELKTCTLCGAEKQLREFSLSRRATATQNAVYRSECKPCNSAKTMRWYHANPERARAASRRSHLAALYGITPEGYDALLRDQGGVCAICRRAPAGRHSRDFRLVIDHCHQTGINRGLLCNRCNRALGLLGDDPVTLRRAITYLMQHRKLAGES